MKTLETITHSDGAVGRSPRSTRRRLQADISDEAYRRLNYAKADAPPGTTIGDIVSHLAMTLPSVKRGAR